MSIYTRTGDKGTTSLFGGKRISKSDLQVEAYGSVDELTSFLGLAITKLPKSNRPIFFKMQKDLYRIMANLSGAKQDLKFLDKKVKEFEKQINLMDKKLPKLTKFILPGCSELSSWFHILRVVCRRAERNVIRYYVPLEIGNWKLEIVRYLNRLSDLFFTLAQIYNQGKDQTA